MKARAKSAKVRFRAALTDSTTWWRPIWSQHAVGTKRDPLRPGQLGRHSRQDLPAAVLAAPSTAIAAQSLGRPHGRGELAGSQQDPRRT
jgi:hypothetical protein